jgi:hypothetical protein
MPALAVTNDRLESSMELREGAVLFLNSGERRQVERARPQRAAQPAADQIRALIERAAQISQVSREHELQLAVQKRHLDQQAQRLARVESERAAAIRDLDDLQKKNREMIAEAEKMRMLAIGGAGVAAGLGLGLAAGVTGPKILLCGAAGGAAGVLGAHIYNELTGEK